MFYKINFLDYFLNFFFEEEEEEKEVSNLRSRILAIQKPELVLRNCQENCMKTLL